MPTIERFDPKFDIASNIAKEHFARYDFAKDFVCGKKVLDIACGTGYGTDTLVMAGAAEVVGVDSCKDSIFEAKEKYIRNNLFFNVGSAEKLNFPDNYFDVVVSFETIEHIEFPDDFLQEAKRVLKPGGILILSTPNRKLVSPYLFYRHPYNKFHRIEYTKKEFIKILKENYVLLGFFGQTGIICFLAPYVIRKILEKILNFFSLNDLERRIYYLGDGPEVKKIKFLKTPTYFVAIVKNEK